MAEEEKSREGSEDLGYMEELSRAYEAAFRKRIARSIPLSEEKRALLLSQQADLYRTAEALSRSFHSTERKEISLFLKESAEECISLLKGEFPVPLAPPLSLPQAVLSANRSLNLLVRHREGSDRAVSLVLSELSALYALASMG